MNLRVPDKARSPIDLAERGLFKKAAEAIDSLREVPRNLLVLRAELDSHIASQSAARDKAERLLAENLDHNDKATCWTIVGRAALKARELRAGLRAMDRALESAAATREPRVQARTKSKVVSALLHWVGVEAASVEMPKLRQLALHSGDHWSLIIFHVLAASIYARRGDLGRVASHLDAGRALLQRFDNEWLRGRLAIVAAASSILRSDHAEALAHTEDAYTAARRSGSREILVPAIGNLATLMVAQLNFERARLLVSELFAEVRISGDINTELNAHATALELALSEGDLGRATELDKAASLLLARVEGVSLYQLHYLLARGRLHYSRGEIQAGLAVATNALHHLEQVSDSNLSRRFKLLAAEGVGRSGRPLEAAFKVLDAVDGASTCSTHIAAEAFRITGRLLAHEDTDGARRQFAHAERIFESVGDLNSCEEVRRDVREAIGLPRATPRQSSQSTAGWQRDDAVALLQLAPARLAFARGLLAWIARSDSFQAANIVATDSEGGSQTLEAYRDHDAVREISPGGWHHVPVGKIGSSAYELVVAPNQTIGAISNLIFLRHIAQMGTSLANARTAERESFATWPADFPEPELGLICSSDRMKELVRTIRQVASSNVTVLLTGETGVGKELFARAVHQASMRSDRTFLPFNCSTVPREMFDSQLFGHKRGAFTGAAADSSGVIGAAAGGTLFLDEIGEMALETQPKLLRFLESGEILRLGETRPQHVDVRVVAATNANLDELVADGRFREDLYYRLSVIRIEIPPLRERREEIPGLVDHFLERFGTELQKPLLRIADETLEYLVLYRWPGNVRQLANEIRRLVAMADPGGVIMPAHLSNDIAESRRTLPANRSPRLFDEVVTRIDQPLSAAVEHIERAAIQRALAMTDGHLDEAARLLGLSRKGLYLKRQRLNLG